MVSFFWSFILMLTVFNYVSQPTTRANPRRPSQRLLRPQNDLDDFLSSNFEASFVSMMSLNSPPANARITSGTTLLPSEHQCSSMAIDISPAPSRTIFHGFKGKIQTRPRSRTFGRELGNFGTPSANDSLMGSTKSGSGKRLQRSALPSEWMNSFSQSKDECVSNVLAMSGPVLNVFPRYSQCNRVVSPN